MSIEAWLGGLGLERYAPAFAENGVDRDLLPEMSNEDLKDLGVDRLADRKAILRAIQGLAKEQDRASPDATARAGLAGERRQVTVLFSDIVGYTELSRQLGAEETHALLNRYFETVDGIVEGFGGSIDKHMGDNVMAVFGAPIAHDDDPLRAVRAALEIHERLAALSGETGHEISAHIGIASGQVVASGTGSGAHREYTVIGDSVNLAARLQERAAPGETLVSDAVRHAVAERVDCRSLGELRLKGLDAPVVAWRIETLRSAEETGQRVAFVGRRAELGQFGGIVEACRASGAGQAVVVRGEAGIGKTRLVEEYRAIANASGFTCHKGLVLDFGVGKGQDAIRAIVRSLLGLAPGSGKALRRAAAAEALAEGLLAAEQRVFLNDLLDLEQSTEDRATYDAMDNTTRNERKCAVVADLVRNASVEAPLVVVVEDIHWASSLMLDHLAAMAGAATNCPALLVMTSRNEGYPLDLAWRAATGGCALMTLDLGPLRRTEALTLAGSFIDATDQFAQDCIERAAGNPLFLEQLLHNAEDRGDEEVPASIQSLVLARMDRLSPADKRALQAASAIGQRFALDLLRHLLEDAGYDCAGLIEHHLVRAEGDDYLFAHALIRDGVYSSLLKANRQALHLRAAGWFADHDLVLRAEHLDRADAPAAPKAYMEAAEAQATLFHYDFALDLAERGRALAEGSADEFALTLLLGQLLTDAGLVGESLAAYRRALELAADDIERCKSWIGIAEGLRLSNQSLDALALLERAEPIAKRHDLILDLAQLYHLRGNLHFPLGNVEACGEAHARSLEFARKAATPEAEARSLSGMADAAYARGRMASAHRYFSDCVALSRQQGLGRIEVANLAMAGWTLHFLNEVHQAREMTLAAAESSNRVGHRRAELNATSCALYVLYELADMDRAPAMIERVRELIAQLGASAWEPAIGWHLAQLHQTQGQHDRAIAVMERYVPMARETSLGFLAPRMLSYFASITDDPTARKAALAEAEAMLRDGTLGHNFLGAYRYAIDACLRSEDWAEMERFAAALEDYTRAEPLPWSDFFIARGRALAARGRGARDEATLRELRRLRDEASRAGLRMELAALDEALADF